jgi:acetolactate synthase-1/2/3 large subunit
MAATQAPVERAVQGGKHIGAVLKEEGVQYYFCVTGGHIFPIQVGIGMQGILMIHCRHEQAAGYCADGYARSSGKVGIAMGTAGPGATNMFSAVAQAFFAKVPLVAIMGEHGTNEDGRGALQELRPDQIYNAVTKWTRRIVDPTVMALWVKKAVRDAMTYPQGPVVLSYPRNVQAVRTTMSQQAGYIPNAYKEPPLAYGDPAAVEQAVKTLLGAARPAIAGGEDIFWSHAENELKEFVELTSVPVITRRNGRGAVPENHPLAFSGRARGAILRGADVAMTIGLQLGFLEGYGAWAAKLKLIQVTQTRSDLETTAPTAQIVIGNPKAILKQMIDYVKANYKNGVPKKTEWLAQVSDIKAKDKQRMVEDAAANKNNKPIHPSWLAAEACEVLDKDATIILDGFTSSHFFTEKFESKHSGGVLDAGTYAGVGHGVGMGIGAQLARPGKQTLAIMGDGGMGLGGFDVETAVRSKLPVVYLLSNNSAWMAGSGIVYQHAMPVLGEQDEWTHWFMHPTRYDQVFAAMGAYTERLEDPTKIKETINRAFEHANKEGRPAVVDTVVDRVTLPTGGAGRPPSIEERIKATPYLDPEDVPPQYRHVFDVKK